MKIASKRRSAFRAISCIAWTDDDGDGGDDDDEEEKARKQGSRDQRLDSRCFQEHSVPSGLDNDSPEKGCRLSPAFLTSNYSH
ncbi:unnamed protein product [Allacma fusca]|uniref:Uncharacterized protein n=1 Tax=Allacma fusca TaxID=39272 RepID=A0A8J2KEF2_9HEXA|nr:unnamed protein product [Allacma fusca]